MIRRGHPNPSAFLCLLLDRVSLASTAAATLPTALTPFRHLIERLLGGTGALSSVAAPDASGAEGNSRTLHFLHHSCGLTEPEAAAAAARLRLHSTKNVHAVLACLRDLGFAPTTVARLVAAFPVVLSCSCTTLGAKFDFYRGELGLSDAEVRRRLLASPSRTVTGGLDSRLCHNHQILKDLIGTDKNVRAAIKQSRGLIFENLQLVLLPKLNILRNHGVTKGWLGRYFGWNGSIPVSKNRIASLRVW